MHIQDMIVQIDSKGGIRLLRTFPTGTAFEAIQESLDFFRALYKNEEISLFSKNCCSPARVAISPKQTLPEMQILPKTTKAPKLTLEGLDNKVSMMLLMFENLDERMNFVAGKLEGIDEDLCELFEIVGDPADETLAMLDNGCAVIYAVGGDKYQILSIFGAGCRVQAERSAQQIMTNRPEIADNIHVVPYDIINGAPSIISPETGDWKMINLVPKPAHFIN